MFPKSNIYILIKFPCVINDLSPVPLAGHSLLKDQNVLKSLNGLE